MGYRLSTPINVLLYEARMPPLFLRFSFLCRSFISRVFTSRTHPLSMLESIAEKRDCNVHSSCFKSIPLIEDFTSVSKLSHLLDSGNYLLCYSDVYEASLYSPEVNTSNGRTIKRSKFPQQIFDSTFNTILKECTYWFTDGSKIPGKPFTGFAVTNELSTNFSLFRAAEFLSSYSLEAMAILEALKLCKNEDTSPVSHIFSDSLSVISAVESKFDPGRSPRLILDIKKSLMELNSSGKKVILTWVSGHLGVRK